MSFTGPAKPFSTPAGIMYCKDQNLSRMLSARSPSIPSVTCKNAQAKMKGVDTAGAGAMCITWSNVVKSGHDVCCCRNARLNSSSTMIYTHDAQG